MRRLVWLVCIAGCAAAPAPEADPLDAGSLTVFPTGAGRGETVTLHLEADDPLFRPGTSLDFGPDVLVEAADFEHSGSLWAVITVGPGAEEGARNVVVSTDDREAVAPGAFVVTAAALSLSPATWPAGEVGTVSFTGSGTTWTQAATWPEVGAGLRVLDWTVHSETEATARIAAEPYAAGDRHEIAVQGDAGLPPRATVEITPLEVSARVVPSEILQNSSFLPFYLEGDELTFDGATIEMLDAAGVEVGMASNGTGYVSTAWEAPPGPRDAVLTTDGRAIWMPGAFDVVDVARELDDLRLDITLQIERDLRSDGSYDEVVAAEAVLVYTNACVGSDPPGTGPTPYDDAGAFAIPPAAAQADCLPSETADAGAQASLTSEVGAITLDRVVDGESVAYRAAAPTLADYAFGELHTFEAPGAEGGLEAIRVEDAIPTVPVDFALEPLPERWPRAQDLVIRWTAAQTYPEGMLSLRILGTLAATGEPGFVGALPWDDGEFTLDGKVLAQLEPGDVILEVSSWAEGPSVAPFGGPWSVRYESTVTWRAEIVLE